MRVYEFHSELPPEQVTARLKLHERRINAMDEGVTSVQFLNDGSFYLLRTPSDLLRQRPAYPFHGMVAAEKGGSRITGTFGLMKKARIVSFALVIGVEVFLEICFGVWKTPVLAIFFLLLVAAFFSFCICLESRIGSAGQRRETLRFMEEHLLREVPENVQ